VNYLVPLDKMAKLTTQNGKHKQKMMSMNKNTHKNQLKDDPTDPKWLQRQAVLTALNENLMSCSEIVDEIYKNTGGWKPNLDLVYALLSDLKVNAYICELSAENGVIRYKLTETGKDLLVEQTKIKEEYTENTIKEAQLKKGFQVLDYACGPGRYMLAVLKVIGPNGKLYALDAASAALEIVRKTANANNISNVKTIESSCKTGLPNGILDAVLLYDAFHCFKDQNAILSELHRVLKPTGILSFNDIHMTEKDIVSSVTSDCLFKLKSKNLFTYTFKKA
jgi:DNA-binding PadR family transcriptional regulator